MLLEVVNLWLTNTSCAFRSSNATQGLQTIYQEVIKCAVLTFGRHPMQHKTLHVPGTSV